MCVPLAPPQHSKSVTGSPKCWPNFEHPKIHFQIYQSWFSISNSRTSRLQCCEIWVSIFRFPRCIRFRQFNLTEFKTRILYFPSTRFRCSEFRVLTFQFNEFRLFDLTIFRIFEFRITQIPFFCYYWLFIFQHYIFTLACGNHLPKFDVRSSNVSFFSLRNSKYLCMLHL